MDRPGPVLPSAGDSTDCIAIRAPDTHPAVGASSHSWQAGDEVEAHYLSGYKSGWYPAVIAGLNHDGTFLLDWDDGDWKDRNKTARQIRGRCRRT